MLLERENEKKNRGKATKLLPDDICDKLKDLDLKGSGHSEGKLNISLKHNTFSEGKLRDNFSEMKDSKKNNFGDDINKIGDQLRNVRITEKEYNFPTKNAEIVLNILCDNNAQDNKNYNIDSNINVDEEQPLSNERKIPKTDVLKDEKVYMKAKSDSSSVIHNEVEKVDENTEKRNYVSDDSKKTAKNVEVVSRGPHKQKIFHHAPDRYNPCSRGHHSGGSVRVSEEPSQPTMNGYPWSNNSQLNIIPNDQVYYPPSMQTPFLAVAGAPTANINTSLHAEQGISPDDEVNVTVGQILQEFPDIYTYCIDALSLNDAKNMETMVDNNNQNIDEVPPSSPEDSGTSSLGSPRSYQPPSVGGHDSGLDSPPHGIEYPPETPRVYDVMKVSGSQKGQVTQQWSEMWQASNERPDPQGGQDMLKKSDLPSGQVMQQGPFPQGAQQRLLPPARNYPQEKQNNQFLQGIRGNKIIREPNIQEQLIIPENNICPQLPIVSEKIQVRQIIQEGDQWGHIEEKRSDMRDGQSVPVTPCRDSVPQICELQSPSPPKCQVPYRYILPKPSSAKEKFKNLLDKDRKLLAWVKINEKIMADPKQLESQDEEGDTNLMIACCNKFECHLEMIYAMVEKLRLKPNSLAIRNKQGHTALYLACEVLYDVPEVAAYIAEALVEQKVDVANMTYDGGFTLIEILEKKGDTHKKVLEGLLALKDSSGKNVFHCGGDVNANNFKDFNESIVLL